MIQISVYQDKSRVYTGFEVLGHAGFAEYGEDIVCAAVSILVLNTINSIETFTSDPFDVSLDEERGHIDFRFQNNISDDSVLLLNSLVLGLQGIEEEYGNEYIKLILKEV